MNPEPIWIVILFVAVTLVTSIPVTTTVQPLPGRGPRPELNETGTLLYKQPFSEEPLLCKTCSPQALSDSSFSNQQQPACIKNNFPKKHLYKDLAPYCNTGTDLSCGPPKFNHTNTYWECPVGYTNKSYTIYSICTLTCNITHSVIGQLYCRETLEWYQDLAPTEDCKGAVTQKRPGTNILVIVLPVVGVVAIIIIIIITVVCRRRKTVSRSSSPVQQNKAESQPLQERNTSDSSSIGDCSIDPTGPIEDEDQVPLMQVPSGGQQAQQKVSMATSTSSLNPGTPDQLDSGVGSKTDSNTPQSEVLQKSTKSDETDAGSARSESGKSDTTNASQGKKDIKELPYLKVFTSEDENQPSMQCNGIGNAEVQRHIHCPNLGSDVCFVSSTIDILSLVIERKDERKFRGIEIEGHFICLEKVTTEDAGLYKWTITYKCNDGVICTNSDTEQLCISGLNQKEVIRNPDPIAVNLASQHIQNSTMQPKSESNSPHNNVGDGQQVNSERLPPEGAENEARQVSNPNNGARPKINPSKTPPANNGARPKVYPPGGRQRRNGVPRNPSKDLNDPPGDSNMISVPLNPLNKLVKESENDLNQFDSPRNISSGDQNVETMESLENNVEVPDSIGLQKDLEKMFSDANSQNRSRDQTNSGMSFEDNASNNTTKVPSLPSAPSLEVNSLLSSEVNSVNINNDRPNEAEHSENGEQDTDSVELALDILDSPSDTHLDVGEILDSGKSNNHDEVLNDLTLNHPGSLSHLNPDTIGDIRSDPPGDVELPVIDENYLGDEETDPKVIVDRNGGVRGETGEGNTSNFDQPRARVGVPLNGDLHSECNHGNHGNHNPPPSSGPREQGPGVVQGREAVRGEVYKSEEGAVGGVPNVNEEREQILQARSNGPFECTTPLSEVNDSTCLEEVCYYANPRKDKGDCLSWFGLCLFYGVPRHFLEAVCCAKRHEVHQGPMYYVMTDILARKDFTVGHIVQYFTRTESSHQKIVEWLVNKCENHKGCRYCKRLLQNN